jgi:1,2-diacylglycerol 3-alpha-glucosyltransferase
VRIGLVTDFYYPWIGGPAGVVHNLACGLAQRGHSTFVLAPSPDGPTRVDAATRRGSDFAFDSGRNSPIVTRARSTAIPVGFGLRVSSWPVGAALHWLDQARPDVVHVHHPFPLCVGAIVACRRRAIPVVATNHTIPECSLWGIRERHILHSTASRMLTVWIAQTLTWCDRVVVPTETAAMATAALGYDKPISVISNGVDTDRFSPGEPNEELRSDLGLDRRPIVLYTGRLDSEKQMDVWIRAAAGMTRSADAQFVVGGQGKERRALENFASKLGLSDRIRFIGYLTDEKFPDLYRLADVFFITSPVELQSISTLEAVASGLPVVAVRSGALPELVDHGRNGYLVAPGD